MMWSKLRLHSIVPLKWLCPEIDQQKEKYLYHYEFLGDVKLENPA